MEGQTNKFLFAYLKVLLCISKCGRLSGRFARIFKWKFNAEGSAEISDENLKLKSGEILSKLEEILATLMKFQVKFENF